MAYFNQGTTYAIDPAILAFTEGNIANISVTVDDDYITLNADDKKIVPAGMWVADVAGVYRFLPRATVTQAATTSDTTLKFSPYNVFVAGDVLYFTEPYVTLTITASTAAQTQTITVLGFTATATATTTNVTTTATEVVAAINSTAGLSDLVYAVNAAGVVYIFAKDGVTNYGVTEGGTVTATLSAATMSRNTTAIGTISTITNSTGLVTLTGTASAAVPIGAHIGVAGAKVLGLHVHAVDYTIAYSKDLALYTQAAGVRTQYLPYFDGAIKAAFPKMLFDTKF